MGHHGGDGRGHDGGGWLVECTLYDIVTGICKIFSTGDKLEVKMGPLRQLKMKNVHN